MRELLLGIIDNILPIFLLYFYKYMEDIWERKLFFVLVEYVYEK